MSTIIGTAERVPLPDVIIRAAIQRLCSRTATRLAARQRRQAMPRSPPKWLSAPSPNIPMPPTPSITRCRRRSSRHVLGPNRKYSSCFYKDAASTLQEAEEEALRQTVEHADLADGQSILELGCGWGSLSLWMARQFPNSQIVAVSNSHSQREYIEGEAAARGLTNLRA